MRITPTEGGKDRREGDQSGSDQSSSGLRGVVGSLLSGIRRTGRILRKHLRAPLGAVSKRSAGSRHSQLRVSGQKRLSASNKTDEDRQPKPLPDGTQVCAEHDEDILRVYDPDRSEAYITSDTWQNIER